METIKRKSQHEIIDLIASSYTSETRSTNASGGCLYRHPDGRTCAAGMLLKLEVLATIPEATSIEYISNTVDSYKPEYAGYPARFYQDMQSLHDNPYYWDIKGLSALGRTKVEQLKIKWNEA